MSEQPSLPEQPSYQNIEEKIQTELRKQQDLSYGIIGGISAALISGAIWAVVTVATGYQIGYMAIGVGLLVGFAVRFFGAGVDTPYRIIGASCALLGCMAGNLFSQVWFIAEAESLVFLETLGLLNFDLIVTIYQESFSPMDIVFYGIAVYEGYRFAAKDVSDTMIEQYNQTGTVQPYAFSNLRLPIVIACFVSIGILLYVVTKQATGLKTYYYESGEKSSEGEVLDGKENGLWTIWYPSGQVQLTGNYKNGYEEGDWKWYGVDGETIRTAGYKYGLLDGVQVSYYSNGIVADSGNYSKGRKTGLWTYRNAEGKITSRGAHALDLFQGEWESFYTNGSPAAKGNYAKGIRTGAWKTWYTNGKPSQELEFITERNFTIHNAWDISGRQVVTQGNGTLTTYNDAGNILEVTQVKEGKQTGTWTGYHPTGNRHQEGEFKGDLKYVFKTWSADGTAEVTAGNGAYNTYYDAEKSLPFESGMLSGGLREGLWITFLETGDTATTAVYVQGKMNGPTRSYYPGGLLYSEGEMMNDQFTGEWKWYTEDGALESTVTYRDNKKEGSQLFFNSHEDIIKEEVYQNGELVRVTLLHEE